MRKAFFCLKSFFCLFMSLVFILSNFSQSLYAYSMIPEFLCEMGIKFYQQGRYDEALSEFKKALIVNPDYAPALNYIQMIEKMQLKEEIPPPAAPIPTPIIRPEIIKERPVRPVYPPVGVPEVVPVPEKIIPSGIIKLDESLSQILQPIEIEQGKSIIIVGKNIRRFLVTYPNILTVERNTTDQLSIIGKEIGYTYVHFWDDNGRWTAQFLVVLPRPEEPTVEELMRKEEERAQDFKLRYNLSWNSYEQGRRIDNLNRQSYSWYHSLDLTGATPYGNLYSTAVVRALEKTNDLTYFTLGLNEGMWGPFKDFSLRGFDFYPGFTNLAFGGGYSSLRGAMIESPAFGKKIDYRAFWGREGGGRYGNLSPGLQKTKNSFVSGFDLDFDPLKDLNLGFSVVHGYGRDRPSHLNQYAYDLNVNWRGLSYEVGHDSETFAHLFSGKYNQPKLNLTYELRNIDKDYLNITGETWRRGEIGGLFTLNYAPNQNWNITNYLDVYQDRLFPCPEDDDRWNQTYDFNARYIINPTTSLRLDYTLRNELGKISQLRYQTPGIGLSKSFKFIKDIGSYIDYHHQESKNYTGPSMDYINENISVGLRFSLIDQLYYFLNKQWNWLEEKYASSHFRPHAFETGLDFNSQIFKTPFYTNARFMYRDEENATSTLSFLSGEDYIEGYAELSYRPSPDTEAYCSSRIRNVWAENPNVTKRIEADFNAGMRYLWDTGLRWESVGDIEGYVFKDLNSDGLRQKDEAPVGGIKIWLGKKKSVITDMFGHYKFAKIKGKKAFITLDLQSLPSGFVLTVPQVQEAVILQGRTSRVDFGMVSRSEICGIIFYDTNEDGVYNAGDTGIKDIILTLEDGSKARTDIDGRYCFKNVSAGEHTITLDLKSLSVEYLPQVAITKKITLFEGITYLYNIPLKRVK